MSDNNTEQDPNNEDKYAKYDKYKYAPKTRKRLARFINFIGPSKNTRDAAWHAAGSAYDTVRNIRLGSAAATLANDLLNQGQGGKKRKSRKKRKTKKRRKSKKKRKSQKRRKFRKKRKSRKQKKMKSKSMKNYETHTIGFGWDLSR